MEKRGFVGLGLLLIIAVVALACACAPTRWLMHNDQGQAEAVCYEASGGLFGGPSLQCIAAHDVDGGVK
jgi:hypothetical protein